MQFLTVRHTGVSAPAAAMRIYFPVILSCLMLIASAGCKKQPPPMMAAQGSLQDDHGNCLSPIIHGQWYNGLTSDSSYVEVGVYVAMPGKYNIITDKQNGVIFSANGTFTDTGMTTVRLQAAGLFIAPGATRFTTAFNGSACEMTVTVLDSSYRDMKDNTWTFTVGGHVYHGNGSTVWYELPALGDIYTFYGSMAGFSDTSLTVNFAVFYGRDSSGAYPTNLSTSNYFVFTSSRFSTDGNASFVTNSDAAPALIFIHPINNGIVGVYTFNGTTRDSANNIVPITNARFRASNPRFVNFE